MMSIFPQGIRGALFLLVFSAFIGLAGCGPDLVYDDSVEVPESGWAYENPLRFNFSIEDTNAVYNLWLEVEHSPAYKYQNLYTKLHTTFPAGQQLEEMVSLELADKAGAWHGECNGEKCKLSIPVQIGAFFNQAGGYTLSVEQFMREDSIEGVNALRFMIEDTDKVR